MRLASVSVVQYKTAYISFVSSRVDLTAFCIDETSSGGIVTHASFVRAIELKERSYYHSSHHTSSDLIWPHESECVAIGRSHDELVVRYI